LDLEADQE